MIYKLQDIQGSTPYKKIVTPFGWEFTGVMMVGCTYRHKASSMKVICSLDDMGAGRLVLHVSVSRKNKLPTWNDLKLAKNSFMGSDVDAFHVIPKTSDHVNIHNFTMHLWSEVPTCDDTINLKLE